MSFIVCSYKDKSELDKSKEKLGHSYKKDHIEE